MCCLHARVVRVWLLRFDPAVRGRQLQSRGEHRVWPGVPSSSSSCLLCFLLMWAFMWCALVHHQCNDDSAAVGNIWGKGSLPRCAFITILLVPWILVHRPTVQQLQLQCAPRCQHHPDSFWYELSMWHMLVTAQTVTAGVKCRECSEDWPGVP